MKRFALAAAILSACGSALLVDVGSAWSAEPKVIRKVKIYPLPVFETPEASPEALMDKLDKSQLSGVNFPLPIIKAAGNGMYLVEIKGREVWVLDNFVQVDTVAKASVLGPETMGFSDKDLGASRGYGEGE